MSDDLATFFSGWNFSSAVFHFALGKVLLAITNLVTGLALGAYVVLKRSGERQP